MKKYFNSTLGRLRLLGILEGASLLFLVFVAVPIKYISGNPSLVKAIGPIHGILFVFNAVSAAIQLRWNFREITWKVLLACLIPLGTFYIDKTVLSKIHEAQNV